MSAATALSRLNAFRRHHEPALHLLACHAALPVVLNPELVHLLRVNYFLDPPHTLPYQAEAQLLLSGLCHEVDDGLYAIDPDMRDLLLGHLVERLGSQRLKDVAQMLGDYSRRANPWRGRPGLAEAQQLTALNFLRPAQALALLAEAGPGDSDRWYVALRRDLRDRAAVVESAEERAGTGATASPALREVRDALAAAYPDRPAALGIARAAHIPDPGIPIEASPTAIWQRLVDAAAATHRLPALFAAVQPFPALARAIRDFWVRNSPALPASAGTIGDPPAEWQVLDGHRGQLSRTLAATCLVSPTAVPGLDLLGFLAGPRTVITVIPEEQRRHFDLGTALALSFADSGPTVPTTFRDVRIESWYRFGRRGPTALTLQVRPEDAAALPTPLAVTDSAPTEPSGRLVYVVGYPSTRDPGMDAAPVSAVLGDRDGILRVQPGELVGLGDDGIAHTCFATAANTGSPLVDLATGEVLGVQSQARYDPGPTGLTNSRAAPLWPFGQSADLAGEGVSASTPAATPPPRPAPPPRAASNPFQLPRQAGVGTALSPWRHPEDASYYVDVGGSTAAYHHFQASVRNVETLLHEGAFAVAYGGEKCGKTALRNRCASWLRDHLNDAGLAAEVVDLSWAAKGAMSLRDRSASVASALTFDLEQRGLLNSARARDILTRQPSQILDYLALSLPPRLVVIVLLPPSGDLIDELAEFARQTRGPFVLLGETAWESRFTGHPYFADPRQATVRLHVGPLRPGDGWHFVRDRLTRWNAPEPPRLRQETVNWLTELRPMSVGELQLLMHEVYAEAAKMPTRPSEITRDLIARTYLQRTEYT